MAQEWLRVGEVSRRSGLTVRTLHHYDQLGLLVPSGRSSGDYRLYSPDDLRRLLAVTHLKSLGLSLDEVADALDRPDFDPAEVLDRHVQRVRDDLAERTELLRRLEALREHGDDNWSDVLEVIALGERLRDPDPTVRIRALLDEPATANLAELVEGLRTDPDHAVREVLTWAVAQRGSEATVAITAALDDPDPAVRLQMAHVLGKLHDRGAVGALVPLLDDEDELVAAKAAFSLGQLGGDQALAALVACLGEGSLTLRETITQAIAKLAGQAPPAVLEALGDQRHGVRAHAAEVLGALGDTTAADALVAAAGDPDEEVALAALMALDELPAPDALRRAAGTLVEGSRARLVAEQLVSRAAESRSR